MKFISSLLIIVALLIALSANCIYTGTLIYNNLKFIIGHWGSSEDEKYELLFGDFYNYIKFIKDNTPPSSKILFPPPRRRYRPLGYNFHHSFFLYPREILSGASPLKNIPPVDYIVIYKDFPGCVIHGEKLTYNNKFELYKIKETSINNNQ